MAVDISDSLNIGSAGPECYMNFCVPQGQAELSQSTASTQATVSKVAEKTIAELEMVGGSSDNKAAERKSSETANIDLIYAGVGVKGEKEGFEYLKVVHGHTDPSDQELYLGAANRVIKEVVETILVEKSRRSCVSGLATTYKRDYSGLFGLVISKLSESRREIAKSIHGKIKAAGGSTEICWEHFGAPRLEKADVYQEICLGGSYERWRLISLEDIILRIKRDKDLWLASGLKGEEFTETQIAPQEADSIDGLTIHIESKSSPLDEATYLLLNLFPHENEFINLCIKLERIADNGKEPKPFLLAKRVELDPLGIYPIFDPLLLRRARVPLDSYKESAYYFLGDLDSARPSNFDFYISPELCQNIKSELTRACAGSIKPLSREEKCELIDLVLKDYYAKLISRAHEMFGNFKKSFSAIYEKNRSAIVFNAIRFYFFDKPDPADLGAQMKVADNKRTSFVSFKVGYSIDGSDPVDLTSVRTWIDVDPARTAESIFATMKEKSFVYLQHQDCMDMERTLKDASVYFTKAMNWTVEEGIDALKEHVGCMMYLLAHNHRDVRGTAAESEWLERAIYRVLGFGMNAAPDRMPDLLAFTSPCLTTFMSKYKESFLLKNISN